MAAAEMVEREFEEWRTATEPSHPEMVNNVALLEVSMKKDGAARVHLLLGSAEETYAVINGDAITVSSPSSRMATWCEQVNGHAAEHGITSLGHLLSYAVQAYSDINGGAADISCDSEDDSDNFDNDDEDFDAHDIDDDGIDDAAFTTDWEVEIARNKKRWLQKEEEIRSSLAKKPRKYDASAAGPAESERAASKDEGAPAFGVPTSADRKQASQIFSGSAASGILVNDLIKIMEEEARLGFSAVPVDDNIYRWTVKMRGFDAKSKIAEDIEQLRGRFGYDYLELQFEFAIDLFPCFPPQLKIVRPRLAASMLQRVSALEFFKLSYWNPANDMRTVIQQVRSALEEWCRLEPLHEMNDPRAYPEGAFYPIEHVLLRLAYTSEIKPRANQMYTVEAQLAPRLRVEKEADGEALWARGTGYGHGRRNVKDGWDPAQLLAARKENDLREERLIAEIRELVAAAMADPTSHVSQHIGEILEASCLVPYLESYAASDSIFEMAQHCALYCSVLDIIALFCKFERLNFLVKQLPNQTRSVATLVRKQNALISKFKARLGSHSTTADRHAQDTIRVADRISEVAALLPPEEGEAAAAAAPAKGKGRAVRGRTTKSSKAAAKAVAADSDEAMTEEARYIAALQDLQLDEADIVDSSTPHHYKSQATGTSPQTSAVVRLAQEVSSLGSSLPINVTSSVFLRIDESRIDVMKALIIGPEGTPYSGGCFEFDIFFPSTYPAGPPKVNLQTTGAGSVRFNPNLYNCGKVCLSLLGTWEGQSGESWLPESSTLLQVLVSIQSLILVPNPWFNEPGYEKDMHTERGATCCRGYNQGLRANTMRWAMINQIKNPAKGFEDVIRTHFRLRRDALLESCGKWVEEAVTYTVNSIPGESMSGDSQKTQPADMAALLKDLEKEIGKIPKPR